MQSSQPMSPVLELLDQLDGSDQAYTVMEREVFAGDRARALDSIAKMLADELIGLASDGQPVEAWRLAAWRRSPDDPATISSLQRTELSITDRGAEWLARGV